MLAILSCKVKTRSEHLFKTIDDFMSKSYISYDKIMSLSTDGVPAMMSKEKGLVKRNRNKNAGLLSYQCIVHLTARDGKLETSITLKEVMDNLVKLINFMMSHSVLQH